MPERSGRGRRKNRQTKDRVLQARIPEQLDEELRERAEKLGMSVSTVVRNVLLHTFDLVEGVVTDSAQIARALQGREASSPSAAPKLPAPNPDPADLADLADPAPQTPVIGWQEALLNRNGICDTCNAILPVGERAAIGVPVQARPVLLCLNCLAALSSPADDRGAHAAGGASLEKDAPTSNTSKRATKRSKSN